ncbi:MAG: helix-hairpin-helix domain-containing protein, partial [Candidatus Hadarchaeales archaeon]
LVFLSTRRSAQATARLLAQHLKRHLKPEERETLAKLAEEVKGVLDEPTRTCTELAEAVAGGAAFHHAGLHQLQRKIVEDSFRKNILKAICATPTLAAGVNLPSRRVIIRDYRRYTEPFGMQFIPVLEFHQMAGRAGRPKYDREGQAVLIAHSRKEVKSLFEEFIRAPPERIKSKLAAEPALRTHVLAAIASGYVKDEESLFNFIDGTFFSYQFGSGAVRGIVDVVLDFLLKEKMIERKGGLLLPTIFGEKTSMLYIDPLSAVFFRDGLEGAATVEPTTFALLHLICHTPDMPRLYLGEGEYEEVYRAFVEHERELLVPVPAPDRNPEEFSMTLAEIKTAMMIESWIEEVREDEIHERFGVGAGDVRRLAETAEWLLHAAHELSSLFKRRKALKPLKELQLRVRHGVKKELLELVQLRGIGRVRGRSLFRAGYRNIESIRRATEDELARIPSIGKEIAKSIKRQVEEIS